MYFGIKSFQAIFKDKNVLCQFFVKCVVAEKKFFYLFQISLKIQPQSFRAKYSIVQKLELIENFKILNIS